MIIKNKMVCIENKKINCYNEINDNSIANIERVS